MLQKEGEMNRTNQIFYIFLQPQGLGPQKL